MGISNYYFNNIGGQLINDDYWDFHITSDDQGECLFYAASCQDTSCDYTIITNDLVLWFDINQSGTTTDGSSLISLTEWTGTTIKPSSGFTLCDFGLTGVDNGRYDVLSGLTVTITSADTKVVLYPVTGYTITSATGATKGLYDYPWEFKTGTTTTSRDCIVGNTVCLDGGFYQGYFKLDFLKPDPIETTATTTTTTCSGTSVTTELIDGDDEAMIYDLMPTEFSDGWSMETWIKWDNSACSGHTGTTLNDDYSGNTGFFFYIGTRAENKFRNVFSGETGLYTCDGLVPLSPNEQLNINNGGQNWFSTSSHRAGAKCGWCVCDGDTDTNTSVTTASTSTWCDQLSENALGFRIKPDGKIGYRKMTVTGSCFNNEFRMTGTTMEEGYSENSVILSGDSWMHITVTYVQGDGFKNGLPTGTLRFWVNGRVVYRIKDFIGLQLRALNEWSSKQLGVPFNITWGGGTQGLVESQTFNGPDPADRGLQLETYFAGSFLGELSQLRFYDKPLNILEIRNNFFVDCNRYCIRETFGGAQIIQPTSNLCGDCKSGTPATYLLYDKDCFIITETGEKIIL